MLKCQHAFAWECNLRHQRFSLHFNFNCSVLSWYSAMPPSDWPYRNLEVTCVNKTACVMFDGEVFSS